jgi:[lysine-biosynthesis-protein LysW]--L-2-aminoadipate ligase
MQTESGSWEDLLAKINDREAAEAVFDINRCWVSCTTILHPGIMKRATGDVRAFVVDGEPICAITRQSGTG